MLVVHVRGQQSASAENPDGPGKRRPARVLLLSLALAAGLVAAACSSDSKSAPSSSTATAAPTVASASPSPAAVLAPADPNSAQLQTDTGPDNAYSIQIPVGWQIEDPPVPGGVARRYFLSRGGAHVAQITVRCQRGATTAELSAVDAGLVGGALKGQYALNGLKDVTFGGLQGQQTDYTVPLGNAQQAGGPNQETRVVYLQGASCGWQILLQTFGNGQLQQYSSLFDAVLATFRPAAPGG